MEKKRLPVSGKDLRFIQNPGTDSFSPDHTVNPGSCLQKHGVLPGFMNPAGGHRPSLLFLFRDMDQMNGQVKNFSQLTHIPDGKPGRQVLIHRNQCVQHGVYPFCSAFSASWAFSMVFRISPILKGLAMKSKAPFVRDSRATSRVAYPVIMMTFVLGFFLFTSSRISIPLTLSILMSVTTMSKSWVFSLSMADKGSVKASRQCPSFSREALSRSPTMVSSSKIIISRDISPSFFYR